MRFSFLALSSLLWAAGEVLAGKLSPTDTITWGGDNSRTGYSSTHNMDPSVVGSSQFGQLWKALLPGNYGGKPEQIFSQPLVYTLDDGIQYVFIATTQNNVYKLNAKTGAIIASRSLHVPFLTLDLDGCVDINPYIGVTATGVIDPSTDTWYLTAKTYVDQSDAVKGRANGRYWYHAIDVNTLAEKDGFPQNLEGTIARNNPNRMFQGGNAHQRPALLLSGQYVYAGFASHCVQYNFTGWIMGWDKTSGALVERFATEGGPEPNTVPGGGVWMSGGGLASDNKGSMFFATGNGYASQLSTTPVPGRQPPTALEEAAVNMKINSDGSLSVVDFFMPWEKTQLDGADKDLGTSPLELLQTDVFTCPNVKRLGVVTGKSGKTYWLNLDNLGGYQQGANKLDAAPQVTQNENSVYAGAGVYPLEGGYIYINVIQYQTHVFKFSCNANGDPVFTKVADSPEKNAYILGVGHGTTTSFNGQSGTGLVWVSDVEGFNLRVYKAVPQNGLLELIYSANIPGVTKFTRPVFGDGRAYMGTTLGAFYCFGSPVNLPLTCSSPNDFGNVLINSTSAVKTIQCKANIDTQVTGITLNGNANFQISGKPTLPFTVTAGNNVSFQATFNPVSPGPLSSDVLLNTTNGVAGYALTTPVSLKGVGESQDPLLAVSPNTISFTGVITGQQQGGVTQSIIFSNQGDGPLTILGLDYSIISETGAFVQPTSTPDGPKVGPFTFKDLPTSIPANGQATVDIVFDPSTSGNFAVYVHVRSDGGTKIFDVFGTAGTNPVALLEFQAADGSGTWIEYTHNSPPFTFGDVYEQQTKVLQMRLTNKGDSSAASLSVTVSKPPFGVPGIIGAQNQVDLGEGTILGAGQSATASLFCSVPKSQVNVDSYSGSALWTLNVGDPNFGKQFINFTCNAVAEQVGPLYANGSATYRYAGCYKENNPGRQLQTELYASQDNNTNDKCIAACAVQQYTFAGTQYQTECWCGNNIPILKSTDADCNYACSGNKNETCGGNGYFNDGAFISLFANGPGGSIPAASSGPTAVPQVGAFNYTGCYTEAANGRALSAKTVNTKDMTIERCAGNCTSYQYFGVEYGSECYCGNTLGAGSVKTAEKDCSMTCVGNTTELCGNGNRLNLYMVAGQASLSSSSLSSSSFSSFSSAVQSSPQSSLSSSLLSSANPTTTSTFVATPTGPITVQSAGNFNYTGCYTEATTGRALTGTTLANDAMTVEKCAAFCAAYNYMGIEYARECYCGNTIASGAGLAASGCSMTCSGNSLEYCGGPNRLNFYTANSASLGTSTTIVGSSTSSLVSANPTTTSIPVATPTGPIAVQSAGNFNYTGCYTEATTGRALTGTTLANNAMTVEKCAAFCSTYLYMGIEYASECYCGNTIAAGAVLAASGCSMTCSGNSSEYCGGPNRLNFYTANSATPGTATGSTTSAGTSTSSTTSPVSTPTGPIVVRGDANFTYLGCYVEPANSRALSTLVLDKPQMTVEICLSACSQYTYVGLEYSSECWCGMNLATAATKATAESQCGSTCAGNSSEICGAGNRLTLYTKSPPKVGSLASSSSSISGSSSISQTTTTLSAASSSSVASGSLTSSATLRSSSSSLSSTSSSSNAASSSSSILNSGSVSSSSTPATSSSSASGSSSGVTSGPITSSSGSSTSSVSSGLTASGASGSSTSTSTSQLLTSSQTATSGISSVSSVSSSSVSSSQSASSSGTSVASSTQPSSSIPSISVSTSSSVSPSSSSVTSSLTISSSSTKSVSSSATLSIPTPGQTINSYVYLGCFNETTPRALVGTYKTDNKTNTNAACQQICSDRNYGLAATESGDACACGNGLQSYSAPVPQTFCNTLCAGNASEVCGGSGDAKYLSVWNSTSSTIPPTMVKAVGAYPLDGCYNDTLNAHVLNATTYTNSTGMSVEACVGYCITKNYDVAGLENGQSCYCGSTLASSVNSVAAAQCNMLCTGNRREFCGAYDKLLVYKKDPSSVTANGVPVAVNQDNSAIIVANNTAPA